MKIQNKPNKTHTFSPTIDSTLTYLSKANNNWEIIPAAAALWNGYKLKKALEMLRANNGEQNRVLTAIANRRAAAPMLIASPFLRDTINRRYLRAAEEAIQRSYLISIVHGVRVLRFSAVLLSPAPRLVLENSIDFIAYSTTAHKFVTTTNPIQLRYGQIVANKDIAYRWTKITTYVICAIGSLATVMNHYQYIEESNPLYQTTTTLAAASFASDMLDSALQMIGIFAYRE